MKVEKISYSGDLAVSASEKNKERDYWLNKLSGEWVKSIFPFDMKWKKTDKTAVQKEKLRIGGTLFANLMKLAKGSDYTLNVILLSALFLLVHKYTALKDIIIGTPIYKQKVEGNFKNTVLTLRNRVHNEMTFKELLLEVRQTLVEAVENQNYPVEILIYKLGLPDPGDDFPLFDISMILENIHYRKYLDHIPLNVLFIFAKTDEYIDFELEYNSYIYRKQTMERIGRHFIHLLTSAVGNIALPPGKIDMLSDLEKKQLVLDFNDNKGDFPGDKTVHHFIEEHARKSPDRIAVVYEDLGLTYRQLNESANRLALYLKKFNIRQEQTVGILLERSPRMPVSILAAWKCRGAYIPLDPQYPVKRIAAILRDSGTTVVITESQYPGGEFYQFYKGNLIILDEIHLQAGDTFLENPAGKTNTQTLSYVIYTSGSTGNPKGVAVQHIGMMNHIQAKINDLQITPGSIIAQNASHTFDISVWQFFAVLIPGGKTVIYSYSLVLDLKRFLSLVIKDNITILEVVPSYLSALLAAAGESNIQARELEQMNYLLVTGETVKPALVKQWFGTYPVIKMVNAYGPTEASDDITHYTMAMAPGMDKVPIGKPIQNLNIYIVDEHMELCPPGVKGEIVVSGVGVGRGYLNDAEKTANTFMRDPFVEDRKIMLYKTGDLGCRQPDGMIMFYGRKDYQVKIRGYRIELEEIENKLAGHPGVKEVVVINKEDGKGNVFLCAYLVPHGEIEISGIKEYLLENVADYMVPTHFVELDRLPLTANGKVDRRSLPEPEIKEGDSYEAPRNRIEDRLAGIWSEVLEIDKSSIGIHDNFFEMGGHSLGATILTGKLHEAFNVKVPLAEIFKTSTISGISGYVMKAKEERYSAITLVEKKEYYPLSSAQKRLYFLQQMDGNSTTYNVPLVLSLAKDMDIHKMESAIKKLIARHESLRTSFEPVNDVPVQRIHEPEDIDFSFDYYESNEREAQTIVNDYVKPFDLARVPLFRSGLIELPDGSYAWMVDIHHIVSDGTSEIILAEDFLTLYEGIELEPLRIQYKDFSQWQDQLFQSGGIKSQEDYWLGLLADPSEIPRLNLPADYRRPNVFTFEGGSYRFVLEGKEILQFKAHGAKHGATLFMNFLAVLNILFYKYTGQIDIIIGSGIAGRPHADLQSVIGMFVNMLAMRNNPEGEKTCESFLEEVISGSVKAFENQDLQFEELVEKLELPRDPSRNPLFDISMVVQNFRQVDQRASNRERWHRTDRTGMMDILHTGAGTQRTFTYENINSRFDMTFLITEGEDDIRVFIEYYTGIYSETFIRRLAAHLERVIKAVVENPAARLKDISILSEEEKTQILETFNDTRSDYPADKTIHELFEEQAAGTPYGVSLIGSMKYEINSKKYAVSSKVHETATVNQTGESVQLTYGELKRKSDQVARWLREKGVQPDTIVGIMMERSIEMIIGILGILKAGGAYLPIDPDYPQKRIDYMLKDSGAKILLSELSEVSGLSKEPTHLTHLTHPTHLCYVIYTSGSTGKPKGVCIEHRSIVNTLLWRKTSYRFNQSDAVLQLPSFSFDSSVEDIFTPLISGSQVVLMQSQQRFDLNYLKTFIKKARITHFLIVPALYRTYIEKISDSLKGMKHITIAGENFTMELVKHHYEKLGHVKLFNEYGPTENSVCSTIYEFGPGKKEVLIGNPIYNVMCYILNKWGNLQPISVPGELCISGAGLARGYLNQPELTADKFVYLTTKTREDTRISSLITHHSSFRSLYRTGDLARWLPDGNIEFLGRIDHQVKIRGFRIELGEIENRLLTHEKIKEAIVLARGDANDKYLCAYLVTKPGETDPIDQSDLREYLSSRLPDYMIPSYLVSLKSLPLTPNGKIDRKALPMPGIQTVKTYTAPRDRLERKLAEIWLTVLGIEKEKIGIDINFFEMGGHSLNATVMVTKIHKVLNVKIPLGVVFETPTIRGLSAYIKGAAKEKYAEIVPMEKKEYYPLSSAQKRLYFIQQMDGNSTAYNIPLVLSQGKNMDVPEMESAMKKLITRHESLRTSFETIKGGPVQRIHEPESIDFSVDYYEGDETEAQRIINHYIQPFNLARAPLLRSGLIKLPNGSHAWIVDVHHIVSDGTSQAVLAEDFLSLYEGAGLEPLRIQYKDFSQWQEHLFQSDWIEAQENYWLGLFADHGDIPRLDLSTGSRRPGIFTFEGGRYEFVLEGQEAEEFKAHGARYGATLFMNFLALLNILFYKYTGRQDIIVGTGIAGRPHADLQSVIGMFVNMLVMRNYPNGEQACDSFLEEVISNSIKAFENQDVQFEALVEKLELPKDLSRNPLFDICMVVQNFRQMGKEERLSSREREENSPETLPTAVASRQTFAQEKITSTFDMTFLITEQEDDIRVAIEYYTAVFEEAFIRRLVWHLKRIIKAVVENPAARLKDISILSEKEKTQVLETFNNTRSDYPADKTIHELFEEQAAATPYGVALVGSENRTGGMMHLTYRELSKRSDQVGRWLQEGGIQTDTIVGIQMERCVEMIIGIMGILKASGAYLPIDPEYPQERIDYMLKDSNAKMLLTELPEGRGFHHSSFCIHHCNNLAYVIYTSGTTGLPKGAMINHASLMNQCTWHIRYYDVTGNDRSTQYAGIGFDAMIFEIFPYLVEGAALYIISDDIKLDIPALKKYYNKNHITITFLSTQFCQQFMEEETETPSLRAIITGGEKLNRYIKRNYRLYNNYGPTENTVVAAVYSVEKPQDNIPIGKPIQNNRIYILDKNSLQPQPIGVPGELCIAGDSLARGYLNRPELTAEKFDHDLWDYQDYHDENQKFLRGGPGGAIFSKSAPPGRRRLYRTGDLARWLSDGNIEFLGRIDNQVKIRGFRVELGEIESRLQGIPGIKEACVIDREKRSGEKYLCAYFVPKKPLEPLNPTEVRNILGKHLPDYMVPAHLIPLERIPLTPNGKIDKRALLAREFAPTADYVAPKNKTEKIIAGIWKEVLELEKVGANDNFFEAGGTSLDVIQVTSRMKKDLNRDIPVVHIFQYPTVSALTGYFNRKETGSGFAGDDRGKAVARGKEKRKIRSQKKRGKK